MTSETLSATATAASVAGLNLPALADWLAPHLGPLPEALQAERMNGGQSNPSWRLSAGERSWVLRAKPGPAASLLPSAHAIEREFRVLQALRGSTVPVPRVVALCEDELVIGVAFYVMDWVEGRVLREAHLPQLAVGDRAACHADALQVLAALHRVDWRTAGLQGFGREAAFFSRLVSRWTRQYRASVEAPVPAMERLAEWLPQHIPAGADGEAPTCLTHGDFRLENLMFHPTRPKVVAVLDWELATLGHPLSDLAYHCMAWHLPSGVLRGMADQPLAALGIPGERETIERYCALTGWPVDAVLEGWPFYLACNLFRLAAILLGIEARARQGTAAHPDAEAIARMARPVAELGWAIASGAVPALADAPAAAH
ncbi:phosphotransferase family protein [Hydrogenophaga sp. MI9]|uniref:phosphotransferase family protein n=1 Tax=Hydrogenophaga sp. MI9 TaxID=3453719 RepID=UPI003EEFF561